MRQTFRRRSWAARGRSICLAPVVVDDARSASCRTIIYIHRYECPIRVSESNGTTLSKEVRPNRGWKSGPRATRAAILRVIEATLNTAIFNGPDTTDLKKFGDTLWKSCSAAVLKLNGRKV